MSPSQTTETTILQAQDAVQMYTPRASKYDNTWHPAMAAVFPSWIPNLGPDTNLLDLACGTGLITVSCAKAIGPKGSVTGLDVTPAMLAEAKAKTPLLDPKVYASTRWVLGDAADLGSARDDDGKGLVEGSFDVVTCCSAFQFFADRAGVMRNWATFLKPGGLIVIDVPAPQAQVIDGALETIVRDVAGHQLMYRRDWVRDADSVAEVARQAGLEVVDVFEASGFGSERSATIAELDKAWAYQMYNMPQLEVQLGKHFAEIKKRWEEHMKAVADENGVIREEEIYYVLVARKVE